MMPNGGGGSEMEFNCSISLKIFFHKDLEMKVIRKSLEFRASSVVKHFQYCLITIILHNSGFRL